MPAERLLEIDGVVSAAVPTRRPTAGLTLEFIRLIRRESRGARFVFMGSAMLTPVVLLGAPRLPVVWDANECETLFYRRLPRTRKNLLYGVLWAIVEWISGHVSRAVVSVSQTEATHWRRLFPFVARKLWVVPHSPGLTPTEVMTEERAGKADVLLDRPSIVFIGSMRAKQNREAADWLVSVLAPALPPPWRVVIAGDGSADIPVPESASDRVALLGFVDDVDAVVRAAAFCVAPLAAGAGVKTKMLQYLSVGTPIVATPPAAEGLEDAPGVTVVPLDGMLGTTLAMVQEWQPRAFSDAAAAQRAWLENTHGPRAVDAAWRAVLHGARLCDVTPAGVA